MGRYVNGSAARKPEYEEYRGFSPKKSKKVYKNNKIVKVKIIIAIMIMFVMCAVTMYRYASITELGYDIDKLNKEYNVVESENSHSRIKIEKEENADRIMEIAQTRLGMSEIGSDQIVYVSIPKSDFVRNSEPAQSMQIDGNSFFVSLFGLTKKLVGANN